MTTRLLAVRGSIIAQLILFALLAGAAQSAPPDLILYNGSIFTSSAAHPYVQALAIHGDRILATGSSAEILALRRPGTTVIDLAGRTVIPGINDAHAHLEISPVGTKLPLQGQNPTGDEVLNAIQAAVRQLPPGSLLTGTIAGAYFDPRLTRSTLDRIAPNHPVMLYTATGHAAFLNSAAFRACGIRENQPDPAGGKFERGQDGRLNGLVREYAIFDVERSLADKTGDADALRQLQAQLNTAAQFGITSIQDLSDSMPPARAVALFEKLPPTARIRIVRMPGTTVNGRNTREGRPVPHSSSPWITVNGSKWLLDGTPLEASFMSRETRAAELDTKNTSTALQKNLFSSFSMLFPPAELAVMLRETLRDNDPLILHVSGYPAASQMLSTLQAMGGSVVWSGRRVRFEHGDGLYPDLIPSIKQLGIVVVQNPTHLAAVNLISNLSVGKAQPLRSLLDASIPVALGSDGAMNPYLNIMLASIDPDRPLEAITREQAVIAYTRTSAYAEFAEQDKGVLEPGKLADFAVLSQDIFVVPPAEMPKTVSVLTVVGGKVVYDAKVLRPQ